MSQTIEIIKNHRSIRSYLDKAIPEDVLQSLISAAQAMPTSINGQQVSLIIVQDQETRNKLAELCGGQPWVAAAPVFVLFVMDFYKTSLAAEINHREQVIHESAEGVLVGIFDCGIALGGMSIAAESLGLGVVPIGGIRSHAKEVIEFLGLPKNTFPVNGLCIGYPADMSQLKPRLPIATYAHYEKYDVTNLKQNIQKYDQQIAAYLESVNRANEVNWSFQTSNFYQKVYFPNVYPTLQEQGFTLDK